MPPLSPEFQNPATEHSYIYYTVCVNIITIDHGSPSYKTAAICVLKHLLTYLN